MIGIYPTVTATLVDIDTTSKRIHKHTHTHTHTHTKMFKVLVSGEKINTNNKLLKEN